MLNITEYPESFYEKVFDLFVEHFNVPEQGRIKFINDYRGSYPGNECEAYEIQIDGNVFISVCFYVPDDEYPCINYYRDEPPSETSIKIDKINQEIKHMADRYFNCKAFL